MVTKSPAVKEIANAFRRARRYRDVSQQTMAQVLGVSIRTIQYWETGRSPIPSDRLLRASRQLKLPIQCFFRDDIIETVMDFRKQGL